jgi:NADH-quinone oxidoreductase subunit J
MLLDFRSTRDETEFKSYVVPGGIVATLLAIELGIVNYNWKNIKATGDFITQHIPQNLSNTNALGELIYTHYFLDFQIAGLILLVAMIAAITLIVGFSRKDKIKKQNISAQTNRSPSNTVMLTEPPIGQGVVPGKLNPKKGKTK